MTRLLAAAFVMMVAALLTATPSSAHAALTSSTPADGAKLDTPPDRLTPTFNQDVEPRFAAITLTGPDGTSCERDDLRVERRDVTIGAKPLGPAAT